MKRILLSAFFLAGLIMGSNAQPLPSGASKNKTASDLFISAFKSFQGYDHKTTLRMLNRALEKDPDFIDALMLMGETHREMKDEAGALSAYDKVTKINPDYHVAWLYAGTTAFGLAKYDTATMYIERYLQFSKLDVAREKEAKSTLESAKFASNAIKNPVQFEPESIGSNINTWRDEYAPTVTIDGSMMIFTKLITNLQDSTKNLNTLTPDDVGPGFMMQEDFFVSKNVNGDWQKAYNLGAPINTPDGNEGQPSISADGNVLVYTVCIGGKHCDIYYASFKDNTWGKPQKLAAPVNTTGAREDWESQPSLSFDGKTIYFSSNRPGGYGEEDIYSCTIVNGRWSAAVNLGPNVNTPGKDQCPNIYRDDKTLYFSSDGRPGMGGADLFISRRQEDGSWGPAENMGYPINTSEEELTLTVTGDGEYAYYVTNKFDVTRGYDIYHFKLPTDKRPDPVSYLKAHVFDIETKKDLVSSLELLDLSNGSLVIGSKTDERGQFLIPLPGGKDYALNVSHPGYLFHSENFSLKAHPSNKPYLMEIPLKPIRKGQSVVLKNVFYDTDKFNLKPESKIELDRLAAFLLANPSMKIELGGHTDNQGDRPKNIILSQNRANSVLNYLVSKGIDKSRLTAKGYADTKAIASNAEEKGRAQNRRTEFTITE